MSQRIRYLDLPLRFESRGGPRYRVQAAPGAGGGGSSSFMLPVAPDGLPELLSGLEDAIVGGSAAQGHDSPPVRHVASQDADGETTSPPAPAPEDFGTRLFEALFTPPLRQALAFHLGRAADRADRGVRLRLVLDPRSPETLALCTLPWELMYWPERRSFLCLDHLSPVVRYLEVSDPLPVHEPEEGGSVHILAVPAAPIGTGPLDLQGEMQRLLDGFAEAKGCTVEVLAPATPAALRTRLRQGSFQVLHFLGHGVHEMGSAAGALVFETPERREDLVTGGELATALRGVRSLRLVVLNACNSSRIPRREGLDPYSGVAAALVQGGVPAVVAHQFPISDQAAIQFSRSLYESLAAGEPVEAAVAEGRQAVYLSDRGSFEWATPVLITRIEDGGVVLNPRSPAELRRRVLDQSRLIAERTAGFVGRRFLFEEVERFLESEPRGYFILQGDPGIGKTAFLAEAVRRFDWVHHFNLRAAGITRPESFLENVAAQLILRHRLPYPDLPPGAARDSSFLGQLLEEAAGQLPAGEQLVVAVDALDEADSTGLLEGVNPLFLPALIPPGVYFVVTSRRGEALRLDCEHRSFHLDQDAAANLDDIRTFVAGHLDRPKIQEYRARCGIDAEIFLKVLTEKSQGNFMYLHHVLPAIEREEFEDLELRSLPAGLQGYYEHHWQRMRSRRQDTWLTYQLPVLEALTVVKEPVSVAFIADFTGLDDPRRVRAVLREWEPFLYKIRVQGHSGGENRYRIYHGSFYDFLRAKDELAEDEVSLSRARRRLVQYLKDELPLL
jgi:hypothetical protein